MRNVIESRGEMVLDKNIKVWWTLIFVGDVVYVSNGVVNSSFFRVEDDAVEVGIDNWRF